MLGGEDFATHRIPIDEAPGAYETFQKKEDVAQVKYVIKHVGPSARTAW